MVYLVIFFQKIGNPFKNKIFEITGNPENGYKNVLYEIFDQNNVRDYKSKNESDSYLQIDFKNRSFCFIAYQIYNHSENGNTIKELSMEGSNNGSTWESIGNWGTIEKSLPGPNSSCSAWTNDPSSSYYRFLKIKINGPNTSGNYHLCLKRIELYGILK